MYWRCKADIKCVLDISNYIIMTLDLIFCHSNERSQQARSYKFHEKTVSVSNEINYLKYFRWYYFNIVTIFIVIITIAILIFFFVFLFVLINLIF